MTGSGRWLCPVCGGLVDPYIRRNPNSPMSILKGNVFMVIVHPSGLVPLRGAEAVIAFKGGLSTAPVFLATVDGTAEAFMVARDPESEELVTCETIPGFVQIRTPERGTR